MSVCGREIVFAESTSRQPEGSAGVNVYGHVSLDNQRAALNLLHAQLADGDA